MQGKGSARRPTDEAAYGRNYEAIRWAARKGKLRRLARIVRHLDPPEK
jgi:Ribonuclease G/E